MGGVRRRKRIRKCLDNAGCEPERSATGRNAVFDKQSREHPLSHGELELGSISGRQFECRGEQYDSSESVPTGN